MRRSAHRLILAPIAATLAATLAVGAGVALAKVGQERRVERLRRRDRRLGVAPGESLAAALQRMALGQIDEALDLLGGSRGLPEERVVHETRKSIKRLRALLRLLEGHLGREEIARERNLLGAVADTLAGSRDARVMLGTLDALIERHPKRVGRRPGVRRLRARLDGECERAASRSLSDPARSAVAIAELRALRGRVAAWRLPDVDGIALVEPGLARIYSQGSSRARRAAKGRRAGAAEMHAWRKRVKDLRYAAEMLDAQRPRASAPHAKRRRGPGAKQAERDLRRLRRLTARADRLGEALGEDHDLAVLGAWLDEHGSRGPRPGRVGKGTRRELHRAIAARRRAIRRSALSDGERLYRSSPERFVGIVRAARAAGERLS